MISGLMVVLAGFALLLGTILWWALFRTSNLDPWIFIWSAVAVSTAGFLIFCHGSKIIGRENDLAYFQFEARR